MSITKASSTKKNQGKEKENNNTRDITIHAVRCDNDAMMMLMMTMSKLKCDVLRRRQVVRRNVQQRTYFPDTLIQPQMHLLRIV